MEISQTLELIIRLAAASLIGAAIGFERKYRAKGAGIGAGIYRDASEAFASLRKIAETQPDEKRLQQYQEAYLLWKERLETILSHK